MALQQLYYGPIRKKNIFRLHTFPYNTVVTKIVSPILVITIYNLYNCLY